MDSLFLLCVVIESLWTESTAAYAADDDRQRNVTFGCVALDSAANEHELTSRYA